jgi:molybdopterin-containing oxidoreductase family membrane subunit
VAYAYVTEYFVAWYSANPFERASFWNRAFGDYWWATWTMLLCNGVLPQFLWFGKVRRSIPAMFVLSLFVNLGMWFERFVIIVSSLHQDFLPSAWAVYRPTLVDYGILMGSFGLFFTLVLLFARVLPVIATTEMKAVLPGAQPHHPGGAHE